METWLQDIRYGLRALRKSPGLTAIVAITIALGVGANTAMFSLINGFLIRPLPVPSPNNLQLWRFKKKIHRWEPMDFPIRSLLRSGSKRWHPAKYLDKRWRGVRWD
jgi:hypothetical protein